MAQVRVKQETKTFLQGLVNQGRAASITDAVTWVCSRVEELERLVADLQSDGRERGKRASLGGDERARLAAVSETALSGIWGDMQTLKRAVPPESDLANLLGALGSNLFPNEWASLLLRLPEAASAGELSRLDAALFLACGWNSSREIWRECCIGELRVLNNLTRVWKESKEPLEELAGEFSLKCPTLDGLFNDLILKGSRVQDNVQKTASFKREVFVVLGAALGKLRSKHSSEMGSYLYRFWRSLGAPSALNDCLAALGLSITSKRGKEEEIELVKQVERQLYHHTKRRGSSELFFASCDNVDESFNSRKQQIGSHNESLHFINSTLYAFHFGVPQNLSRVRLREGSVLDVGILFASPQMEEEIMGHCENNLIRILQPLIGGFIFGGKALSFRSKGVAPRLVSLGKREKTKTYPLPTANFSESRMNEFFMYEKQFLSRFPSGEKVLVAADAKTYLLMKKSQRLHSGESGVERDCDDSAALPVAGESVFFFFVIRIDLTLQIGSI